VNYKILNDMRNFFALLFFSFLATSIIGQEAAAPSAASLYNEGLAKAKAKEYIAALDLFEKAIAASNADEEKGAKIIRLSKKNGTRAAYGAGSTAKKAKDYATALAAYEKGIEYAPEFYSNYKGVAQCQNAMGDKATAIKTYLKAAELAEKAGKVEKAEPLVKKAANIVAVSRGKKDWDNTLAYAQAYLETNESPDVQYCLASAFHGKGDSAKAIEHVDIAIATSMDEDKSKYLMLKAEAHEKLGQKNSAVATYKQVTNSKYLEVAQYRANKLSGK
jgi:tetratricopeptide (TPR) repeat protein